MGGYRGLIGSDAAPFSSMSFFVIFMPFRRLVTSAPENFCIHQPSFLFLSSL
jgi:hypothetical protein